MDLKKFNITEASTEFKDIFEGKVIILVFFCQNMPNKYHAESPEDFPEMSRTEGGMSFLLRNALLEYEFFIFGYNELGEWVEYLKKITLDEAKEIIEQHHKNKEV